MEEQILTDPCAALESGDLNYKNFVTYGFTPWAFALLVAQCGANATLEAISAQIVTVIALLTAIDANTDGLEAQLADILLELEDVNVNLGDVITELQAILVEVENIDDNTDNIEAQLATIIVDLNDDSLFGSHVITSGTQAAPPAGVFSSWLVVSTGAVAFTVDGITLSVAGESTSMSASDQTKIPAPVISNPGGQTYEWRAAS